MKLAVVACFLEHPVVTYTRLIATRDYTQQSAVTCIE